VGEIHIYAHSYIHIILELLLCFNTVHL